MPVQLRLMPETFAVCRYAPDTPPGDLIPPEGFFALTRTDDELSLVVPEPASPSNCTVEPGWRGMKVLGPLDFSMIGILSSLALPLAVAEISVFAISTYDTDYLLVKAEKLDGALKALREAGFVIHEK